jgi:SM-20-related protein
MSNQPAGWQVDTDLLAARLASAGYAVVDEGLDPALFRGLCDEARWALAEQGRAAGVGRGSGFQVDHRVRDDQICWLAPEFTAGSRYLAAMEALRLALNRTLFLGLFNVEAHYARYAPGARYQRHRDAFRGERSRRLSTVLYLNPDWQLDQGGELVLYAAEGDAELQRIAPLGNRLVMFLSEEFPHEVLPAQRERYSVAGWFGSAATGIR